MGFGSYTAHKVRHKFDWFNAHPRVGTLLLLRQLTANTRYRK